MAPRKLPAVPQPQDLRSISDGKRTADDKPLAGVTLELRNVLGQPFLGENALPGTYPDGPIRTVTDANGYYEFRGLNDGTYHVYQVQPDGYIDGLDTPGSSGGFAVNAADQPTDNTTRFVLQTLTFDSDKPEQRWHHSDRSARRWPIDREQLQRGSDRTSDSGPAIGIRSATDSTLRTGDRRV
ncbi:MAG: SdrD B-like domain-containing protein [Pirellulaceae bacterium]